MIRQLRFRHRILWMLIPALALLLIAAGLWARRSPAAAPPTADHARSAP